MTFRPDVSAGAGSHLCPGGALHRRVRRGVVGHDYGARASVIDHLGAQEKITPEQDAKVVAQLG